MSKCRMYLPLMMETLDAHSRVGYAQKMKEMGVDVVFVAYPDVTFLPDEERFAYIQRSGEHVDYFRSQGFEAGIWIESFGFGPPLDENAKRVMGEKGQIVSSRGHRGNRAFCPEDETFMENFCRHVKEIAEITRPDLLMLDDEMCLSVRPGVGCFCDTHMKLYCEALGEELTREELVKRIFTGGPNRYRDTWLAVIRESMRKFCRTAREALDEVAPDLRMGFCSGFTSFDIEGADAFELTHLLAGKNKPFMRFSGAPYWNCHEFKRFNGMGMNDVVEFVRMQEVWGRGQGIEFFHEADCYPRPRYRTPANATECYDMVLQASGGMGSFKYAFCYDKPMEHEMGYYKRHMRNLPMYAHIDEKYAGKTPVGVRVYENMRRVAKLEFPAEFDGAFKDYESVVMNSAFSYATHALTRHGIPVKHEGEAECGIAFGVHADEIEKMPRKLILDRTAAKRLAEKGIDVGQDAPEEKKKAVRNGYRYDNGETEFLVYDFDGFEKGFGGVSFGWNAHPLVGYEHQEQLLDFIGWKYPCITGEPGVYTLCKEDENELAVLFGNFHDDDLFDFDIHLDREYRGMEMMGAQGVMEGKTIHVDQSVPAWGTFSLILKK